MGFRLLGVFLNILCFFGCPWLIYVSWDMWQDGKPIATWQLWGLILYNIRLFLLSIEGLSKQ